VRRLLIGLTTAVVVAGGGWLALGGSPERAPERTAAAATRDAPRAALPAPELEPLPKSRPKVVEPVAGRATGSAGSEPDPVHVEADSGTDRAPTRPASTSRVRRGAPTAIKDAVRDATALPNGVALPPLEAPDAVMKIIEAGNSIARSPYKWGGGHGRWVDTGYDCSGSVSYALAAAGLLGGPLDSGRLMSWGSAGRGKWVTVYANAGTSSWKWPGCASTPPARGPQVRAGRTTCGAARASSRATRPACEPIGVHALWTGARPGPILTLDAKSS
jgi:hypothetical protein